MPTLSQMSCLLVGFCLNGSGTPAPAATASFEAVAADYGPRGANAQQQQATKKPNAEVAAKSKADDDATDDSQDEPIDEELAPAAVQLDVSGSSLLIKSLYQATRETKEKDILARLAEAKKLLDDGADVKGVDSNGRTALHWAVIGSSYNIKPAVLVAYEGIADTLIQKGVEINKEDVYQDTALDYLLYAPTFEMQTLLIENGASSGFLAAFYQFFSDRSEGVPATHDAAVALSRKADLTPGQTLSIRLDGPVYSDRSRTGDPVSATVTYPLCKNGEQMECKDGELLVAPGTRVDGTVLFASKAPNKYMRPRLVLDFSNVVYKNGQHSPLYARVLDVDNARETVRNNEILGIVQPHASTKVSVIMAGLSATNPFAGYAIKGVQTVYGLSLRREILFPSGTDIQIQIVRPSMLKQKGPWEGWQKLPVDAELRRVAVGAPLRTATPGNKPSDPTGSKWTHRIDPHIDRERDWVETDLLFVGTGVAYAHVDRPAAPKKIANATGDEIVTDGAISVVQLAKAKEPKEEKAAAGR